MRKLLVLCVMALLGLSVFAQAEENPSAPALRGANRELVRPVDRTGSCTLTTLAGTATVNSFGWDVEDAYAAYIDAATDGDGGCTPAYYPFLITSVDVPLLFFFGPEGVGTTVNYHLSIRCPADAASGNVTEGCKGPGAEIVGLDVSYTVTQADFEANPDMFTQNVPLTACVNGPFFVVAQFMSYDGVAGSAPTPGFDLTVGGPTTERCDAWFYFFLGGTPDYCWFAGSLDFGCGATCNPGDVALFVNGNAGDACEPMVCAPCTRTYPGDDDSDPIIVSYYHWEQTINLCDFCSDYDMTFDAPAASFTGPGGDAVLRFTAADLGADEFCFNITLTPACEVPTWFRLRSWLSSSIFSPPSLYNGTPNFPAYGGNQTYNFTGDGAPDDLGCFFPDVYTLYIDARNCCCPVRVRFNGDGVLPVEITSFDAIAGDAQVTVGWRTDSESDIDHYEIERNGQIITQVAGLGDSPSGHQYSYVDHNVVNGTAYSYRLVAYGVDGSATLYGQTVTATPTAGNGIVTEYSLMQNFPNPFNPTTTISYTVREMGDVSLKVYSVDGREVATLINATQDAGSYSIDFDASGLASGMYVYKMAVNGYTASQKMVLMK